MCPLVPVLSHSELFSNICTVEVSLFLRVLPRYIGCYYYLPFLFFEDWLSHLDVLSFPEGWHSHQTVAFIMWIGPASQIANLHFHGLAQTPNCCLISSRFGIVTQFLFYHVDWSCLPIANIYSGLAKPPKYYFL